MRADLIDAGRIPEAKTKLQKAQELGVPVLDEAAFIALLAQGVDALPSA